jgi:hypothetical protein
MIRVGRRVYKGGKNAAMKAAEYNYTNVLEHLYTKHDYDFSIKDIYCNTTFSIAKKQAKDYLNSLRNKPRNTSNCVISKVKSKLGEFDRSIKFNENRLKVINDEINKLFAERLELNNSILESKRKKKELKDTILKKI